MKKEILKLGKALEKQTQKTINGGNGVPGAWCPDGLAPGVHVFENGPGIQVEPGGQLLDVVCFCANGNQFFKSQANQAYIICSN